MDPTIILPTILSIFKGLIADKGITIKALDIEIRLKSGTVYKINPDTILPELKRVGIDPEIYLQK